MICAYEIGLCTILPDYQISRTIKFKFQKIADELDFKSQVDLIKELENILNVSGYYVFVQESHIFINYQNQTVPLIIYPSMMSKPEDNGSIYINKDLITYAKPEAIKAIISHFNITE